MRRRWKISIGCLAALVVLLAVNTVVTGRETEGAEVTVPSGELLSLPGGVVQVVDRGPRNARPIVLIHCFTCAINWWDAMIPRLSREHRVIAIDLLGHGGSDKPGDGYSIPDQANLVATALERLGASSAVVVGHSLGGTVATALSESAPELLDGVVIVGQAPVSDAFGAELPFTAALTFMPVVGEALWRTIPDFAIEEGLSVAFAPDYDVPAAFVEDFRRLTYTSYDESAGAEEAYTHAGPLDKRLKRTGIPVLAIFGAEEQIYDPREALAAYALTGARTALVPGAGHSPNVERPVMTASLVQRFVESTSPGTWRESGRGGAYPRPSHTTGRAGPHPAVRVASRKRR